MKKQRAIYLTIERAASEFGIDRRALQGRIDVSGIKSDADGCYTISQIHRVVSGDMEGERLREVRHRANLLELEEQEKRRMLIPSERVVETWGAIMVAIRQTIWNSDLPEPTRRRWLEELRDVKVEDYFTTKLAVENEADA